MSNFDSFQSISKELERLQAQRQQLFERERVVALQHLRAFVERYGIQPQELGFATEAGAPAGRLPAARRDLPRYMDPATGKSWGGRGPRPRWLREALAAGRRLEEFRTAGTVTAPPVVAPAPMWPGVQATGARAVYRNPVTRQTWGGRGTHPRWLRDAIASGKSKDEFLVRV